MPGLVWGNGCQGGAHEARARASVEADPGRLPTALGPASSQARIRRRLRGRRQMIPWDTPRMGQNHSHSIVLSHRNTLNFQRKFFQRATKNRLADPSENRALDFKHEFRRHAICSISATIGINRSILEFFGCPRAMCPAGKRPSGSKEKCHIVRWPSVRVPSAPPTTSAFWRALSRRWKSSTYPGVTAVDSAQHRSLAPLWVVTASFSVPCLWSPNKFSRRAKGRHGEGKFAAGRDGASAGQGMFLLGGSGG